MLWAEARAISLSRHPALRVEVGSMIEAFIRGDNRPSRDLLAADPSLIHSRHPELRSAGHVSRAQQKLREWFQSAKTALRPITLSSDETPAHRQIAVNVV